MDTVFSSITWDEAVRSYLIHLKAVRAANTVHFYEARLCMLTRWANENQIPLEKFGKRHLDEYLVSRSEAGKSQTTLHHDAVAAKAFMKWGQRYDVVPRSLLSDYEVRSAPKTSMYMPAEDDMKKLLAAVYDYWNTGNNPDVRYTSAAKRSFHRDRNYAIILTLLDSACRIGEALSLKLDDYQASQRQLTVRVSKGREPRVTPVSKDCAEAILIWLGFASALWRMCQQTKMKAGCSSAKHRGG